MKYETIYGVPFTLSESLAPGEGVLIRNHHEPDRVYLHPTLAYAMEASADAGDIDAMRDPSVMAAASLRWQLEVIDRAARRAEAHLGLVMLQQDQRRMARRHLENVRAELHDMMLSHHPGEEHAWRRDLLRRTARCQACGVPITEELARRLGIELPEIGTASVRFVVDTSAFDRAMGAR